MAQNSHAQYFQNASNHSGKVRSAMTDTMAKSKVFADKTSHVLMSFLSTILTCVLVLALSVFLYATFYYAYMPMEMHHIPVHLQFQPCKDTNARCSFPSAQLRLSRNQKLHQGQTYSISLKLEIPDSPVNEDHGMFMTCLQITSASGEQIGESCKSSIAQYRSPLLRTMETVTYSPSLLTGWSTQKQEVLINYFSNFQTDPRTPAEVITVEVKSKHLEVAEASLEIHAELKGLKYLMYRHPWISSFFGISTFISILTTIILVSWARFLQNEESTTVNASEPQDDQQPNPVTDVPSGTESSATSVSPDSREESTSAATPLDLGEVAIKTKPSLTSRLGWFLFKALLKLLWQSTKVFFVVTLVIISYEAITLGVDTNNLDVLIEATKHDWAFLVSFINQKFSLLVEALRQK